MSEEKSDYEKAKADFIKELMKPENKLLKYGILWLGALSHELLKDHSFKPKKDKYCKPGKEPPYFPNDY